MAIKNILFFVGVFLFLGYQFAKAEGPILSYTLNGVSSNIVINPVINPVDIGFYSNESIPNWVSIKIQKADDSSIYKTYSPNSCDGKNNCNQIWDGAISPKNKILVDGVYNIIVHIKKEVADSSSYDLTLTSLYTITVDSSVSSINTATPTFSGGGSGVSVSSFTNINTESKTKVVETPKIKTKISTKNVYFIGMPVDFIINTTGYTNESINHGKYFLNFGDGTSEEIKIKNIVEKIRHVFFYEGEYVVNLEYYQNYFEEIPSATDKIIVKMIPVNVVISRVGDEEDFFVEIVNNTDFDVDISRWIVSSDTKSFIFPKNTILDFKKKIILSPKITDFSILDKESLKLKNSQWETIFDYSGILKPVLVSTKNTISKVSKSNSSINFSAFSNMVGIPTDGNLDIKSKNINVLPENLESQAIKKELPLKDNLVYIIGLLFFLMIGISGAYFIRVYNRRNIISKVGEDFEIIDE